MSIEPRKEPGTEIQQNKDAPPNASNLSKAIIRKPMREKAMALNRLGVLALASSPIAAEIALQNLILQGVPGHDIDDKTKGRVYERIAKNEAASEATLLLLVAEVKHLASNGFIPSSCSRTFHNVALNRNASPMVLSKLLEATSDDHTRQNIARNPNASSGTLLSIIKESYLCPKGDNPAMAQRNVTLKLVAAHPNAPLVYLESFAEDKNESIRGAVASNPKASPYLLSYLSTDTEFSVRMNVATNPSTPKEVLLRLCENGGDFVIRNGVADDDDFVSIRVAVARNASTGNDALKLLSMDKYLSVRLAVASNPLVDVDEIFGLEDKLSLCVLARYSKNVKTLDHLGASGTDGIVKNVASNPCVPPGLLERLSTSDDLMMRSEVALNSNAGISVLEKLSRDSDVWVRSNVAKNRSTPPDILNRLVSFSEDEQVVCSAIENPSTSSEAVASCLRSIMNSLDSVRPNDPHISISRLLESLSHRNDVPPTVLALMSKSRFADLRIAMTSNSKLPSSEIARLSKEPVQFVVNFIADNPKVQGAADALSALLSVSGYSRPGSQ